MKTRVVWLFVAGLAVITVAAVVTRGMGFTTRAKPWAIEEKAVRTARRWATPAAIRHQASPVAATGEALERGLKHWADGCAMCHGNDGGKDQGAAR